MQVCHMNDIMSRSDVTQNDLLLDAHWDPHKQVSA